MSQLEVVSDYISDVRTLLQDVVQPYRYDDPSLVVSFNIALMDGRRLRPDLFVYRYGHKVPFFPYNDNSTVHMEFPFRLAFVYGTGAHALLRDVDDVQDTRAVSFMDNFEAILTGVKKPPVQGATPQQQAGK